MSKEYILVIDEGTTGIKVIIFNRKFQAVKEVYEAIDTIYPGQGQVEQDAEEIYQTTIKLCRQAVKELGIAANEIECVGITNQRTSWLLWDKQTGKPIRNMVTWQDSRGAAQIEKFIKDERFDEKFPGLAPLLPPFYLPLALSEIKEHEPEVVKKIEDKSVLWGNIDSWLIYKLTGGKVHATSSSTASNSTVYLSQFGCWFQEMLEYVGLTLDMMPVVKDEADDYGVMTEEILGVEIPIAGVVADQQSALFSQGCLENNTATCTNGTGSFIDVNLGSIYREIPGFYTTIAWRLKDDIKYMVEGFTLTAGASLEWVRNGLGLIDNFDSMGEIAASGNGDVYFVPALMGLATPYHDYSARGSFMGISATTTAAHFVQATLESVAFSVAAIFESMKFEELKTIKLSGGASKSDRVGQLLANLTSVEVIRPDSVEATALGAAEFAAIQRGVITLNDVPGLVTVHKIFRPDENQERDKQHFLMWTKAVERSLGWLS
ncbi:glycerol kinase [Paenibacillaceae bacterium GAS479]|nr:glycerol kinase [Paenibacillaceae bacterium GAS479]